jgi:single-strand DNA-binding protein
VCSLRIACNSSRKDADGAFTERPNYFDVSVFGGSAENVSQYTRKGSRIALDGRLEWREWETADQERRQAVSIVADTVQFLDPPRGHGDGNASDPPSGEQDLYAPELTGVGADAEVE